MMTKHRREPTFEADPPKLRCCNKCGNEFMSDGLRSCPECTYAKESMSTPRMMPGQRRRMKKASDE